jgi:hypothetical protein
MTAFILKRCMEELKHPCDHGAQAPIAQKQEKSLKESISSKTPVLKEKLKFKWLANQ